MTNQHDLTAQLLDQFLIRDALNRYARGVDRCQWDEVRAAFHPDATDDHGAYRGDVDGFIEWVSRRHALIEQSMHFLGNCIVDFADANTALVETYFSAYQRLGPEAGESRLMLLGMASGDESVDVTVLGRYVDRFEKRSNVWRIAKRITTFVAIRAGMVENPARNPDYQWAQRNRTDSVYTMYESIFKK